MARSSRSKGSVSVDLFNLPTLPDERRVATSYLDIPVNFYLPDGKNSKISKIVSRQGIRQTKLLMVMRDLSLRSSILKGLFALIYT